MVVKGVATNLDDLIAALPSYNLMCIIKHPLAISIYDFEDVYAIFLSPPADICRHQFSDPMFVYCARRDPQDTFLMS